ncbi:hypothetical protein P4J09_27755 [Bacillus cereus]|nr:hypothetical protein [Bacillus cereus]
MQAKTMPKIIKLIKANVLAVPFGAKIAKTIEIDSIKIPVKEPKCIYLENEPKNKNAVKNIEMKPKYSLIALSLLEK